MAKQAKRVALVTGGSRGIGLGIARSLAQDGWDVAINGLRDVAEVQTIIDELKGTGGNVIYCRGDVSRLGDRQSMMEQTRNRFGRLDLLVNNAGITSPGRRDVLEATEEAFDHVMGVNLKGAFFLTQIAARWMIEQHQADPEYSGCVINISSISGQIVSVNRGDYCISWSGMEMMTKLWAARLGEFGIPVYEVRPGIIRTDMTAGVTDKYDELIAEGLTIEPRWGTPEDVGRMVSVLARGEITYATGNHFYVDGGLMVRRL